MNHISGTSNSSMGARRAWLSVVVGVAIGVVTAPAAAQSPSGPPPSLDPVARVGTTIAAVLNPETNKLYALVRDDTLAVEADRNAVWVVDLVTKTPTQIYSVPSSERPAAHLAINAAKDKIYLTTQSKLVAIDGSTKTASTLALGGGGPLAVNALNNQIFIASGGTLTQVDGESFQAVATQSIEQNATDVAVNERSNIAFVVYKNPSGAPAKDFSVIWSQKNPQTNAVVLTKRDYPTRKEASYPSVSRASVGVNPMTGNVYLSAEGTNFAEANGQSGDVSGLNVSDPNVPAGYRDMWLVNPGPFAINSVTNTVYVVFGQNIAVLERTLYGDTGLIRLAAGPIEARPGAPAYDDIRVNPVTDKVYAKGANTNAILAIVDVPRVSGVDPRVANDPPRLNVVRPVVQKVALRDHDGPVSNAGTGPVVVNPVTNRVYVFVNRSLMEVVEPAGPDQLLEAIEVTQGIQDLAHSVPLIAGRRTLIRLYVKAPNFTSVTGELLFFSDAWSSARIVRSSGPMAYTNEDLSTRREDLAKSLNFDISARDLMVGLGGRRVTFQLRNLTFTGPTGSTKQVDPNISYSKTFTLQPPVTLGVRVVALVWTPDTAANVRVPRPIDSELIESWLMRAYPVSNVQISGTAMAYSASQLDCTIANVFVFQQLLADNYGAGTHYYGMMYFKDQDPPILGCASGIPLIPNPFVVASGPTGPTGADGPFASASWDTDGSVGDWFAGHELGHTFGRLHVGPPVSTDASGNELGPCEQPPPSGSSSSQGRIVDHNYPYPNAQLSGPNRAFVGYDAGYPARGIPARALPGTQWHDVMSYCPNQWVSAYTYKALLDRLRQEEAIPPSTKLP
jgi:hypothetical protein